MSTGKEKRRSFRIVETVHLKYKVISDRDFQQGLDRWKMRHGTGSGIRSTLLDIDARLNQKLFMLRSEEKTLAECFALLNEKINTVLNELPDLRQAKAALADKPPQSCDLGANGMLFATDKHYPPDTKMFLQFLLTADSRYFETFCRVVRSVESPNKHIPELSFGVGVEFHGMKSAQKDILIQHLFRMQSETIRMRRQKMEAVE